jgi:hypothetical protein
MIKTKQARLFNNQVNHYIYRCNQKEEFKLLKEIVDSGHSLRVDAYFIFPRSKLITKKNTLKKIDANNRLKPALDGLADLIGIDDSHFVSGNCQKVIGLDSEKSYIHFVISKDTIQTEGSLTF